MNNYKEYFKGKKVTVMGLGLLGGALNDAIFLLKCGAELTITDLKSEKELAPSIKKLEKLKLKEGKPACAGRYKLVLGEHRLEDFKDKDFIIQPGNVPVDSPYLLEAQKNNIPIYESESLFMKLAENATVIGVTGTRGKTTVTSLIYEILREVYDKRVHSAGNLRGTSTLALLNKIKAGDFVVLELDSWCLHGMGEIGKSPQISVFTNFMPDHMNFYLKNSKNETEAIQKYFIDKAQIYLNQNKEDYLICGLEVGRKIGKIKSHKICVNEKIIPKNWKVKILGLHNLKNIAYAVAVARVLKIEEKIIKKAVENYTGVEGRLQFVREYKGIKIYNDTNATTPEALEVALKTLRNSLGRSSRKKVILTCGGADKKLDNKEAGKHIIKYADYAFLLAGSGTDSIKDVVIKNLSAQAEVCNSLKVAVSKAIAVARKGDIIVLSPGFASFGMFKNEYDRGDQFLKIIKALK